MLAATIFVWIVTLYFAAGALFAIPFLAKGMVVIDPNTHKSSLLFRLIVAPGVVALWPLLLARWMRGISDPVEQNPHRALAGRNPQI